MRVLLLNHFPLEGSGSGTYTRDVAYYLLKKGHQVYLIFPENKVPDELQGAQCRLVYFNEYAVGYDTLPYNFPCFTTHPRSNTTFADLDADELDEYLAAFDKAISDAIDTFQPDIIHVRHVWLLSYLASKHQIPYVITAHGTDLMGYEKWPRFREFATIAADKCKRVIAISRDNYQVTLDTFPQIKDKTVLLSNGYNNEIFYPEDVDRASLLARYDIPDHGEKIILFAGKLTNFKGVDVLLHATRKYEELHPGAFTTVIAGSGEEGANLRQLAQDLDLQSVHFIGHRNQAELRELYSAADVFVIPSRYEAFGLVALEAMACGLSVVATDKGGLPDFITSEVGTLTTCDPDAIYAAILEEMDKIEKSPGRKTLVAHYAFHHYSMTHYIEELEKIYSDVLAEE